MAVKSQLPATFFQKFSKLKLFGLPLMVGKFPDLINGLTDWLILVPGQVKLKKPISIMVVSMQDIIANKFNPKVAKAINSFDILTMDGMPLVWLARLLGFQAERMYGPDIFVSLLATTEKLKVRHFFYGGQPETIDLLKKNLLSRWPNLRIAGMVAPPFRPLTTDEKKATIVLINKSQADIVWVGLGSWKQLLWAREYKSELKTKLILPVGMAFDLMAGLKPQAPVWLRQLGGEWLFRLLTEPLRLWSRYWWQVPFFSVWWLKELVSQWMKSHVTRK